MRESLTSAEVALFWLEAMGAGGKFWIVGGGGGSLGGVFGVMENPKRESVSSRLVTVI